MSLNAIYAWMYVILALAAGWFAYAQVQYSRAKRAYDLQLAHSVVAAEQAIESTAEEVSVPDDQVPTAAANSGTGERRDSGSDDKFVERKLRVASASTDREGLQHGRLAVFRAMLDADAILAELDEEVPGDVSGLDRLTESERACLRLVDQHMSSKEIARELGLSKHTVDWHLTNARRRLGAADRYEAALRVFGARQAEEVLEQRREKEANIVNTVEPSYRVLHRQRGDVYLGRNRPNMLGVGFRVALIIGMMIVAAFGIGSLFASFRFLQSIFQ